MPAANPKTRFSHMNTQPALRQERLSDPDFNKPQLMLVYIVIQV